MKQKRTLAEVKEILEASDEYLSAVTIPILKEIIFVDLGMNTSFVNRNVADQRKLLDWFNAAKLAFAKVQKIEGGNERDNDSQILGSP